MVSQRGSTSNGARRGWHGGVFHRRRASPRYRYHLGYRDDGKLHIAFADAQRMFRGYARSDPATRRPHL